MTEADPRRVDAARRLLAASTSTAAVDQLTGLAAQLLGTRYAQVSLLAERQVIASIHGLDLAPEEREGPLEESLCTVTAAGPDPLVVRDAREDPRVADLPPVTSGLVRSYLGIPLVGADNLALGALCVYDDSPRLWREEDVSVLSRLATSVVAELELAALSSELAASAARLDLALAAADIGSFDWDLRTGELLWDSRLRSLFGYDDASFVPHIDSFTARVHPEDRSRVEEALAQAIDSCGDYAAEYRVVHPDGSTRWAEARGRALCDSDGNAVRLLGVTFDRTVVRNSRERAEQERVAALAERERAFADREQALARAQTAGERLRVLADASAQLSSTLEPSRVLSTLAGVVVPRLGDWLVVALRHDVAAVLADAEGATQPRRVDVVHVAHAQPGGQEALERIVALLPLSTDDPYGTGRVIRTGRSEWLPAVTDKGLERMAPDGETLAAIRAMGMASALTVPLRSRGRTLGAMTVAEPAEGALDRRLVEDLAVRAGVALDNAVLYGTERRLGLTLQRSLLPRELPQPPDIQIAARYLPGTEGTEVGGDFYVARELPGSRLLLVMGDVMGRGMQAAARMAQLRSVLSAFAIEGDPPDVVLGRLAAEAEQLVDLQLATVLCAIYDAPRRCLTLASAGHPPPLLAPIDARPAYVSLDPGPPVGTGPAQYTARTVDVPPGGTLVLYTDGLVEERRQPIEEGMEQLREALMDVRLPPEAVCDQVLRKLGRAHGTDDDVALLVLSHADSALLDHS